MLVTKKIRNNSLVCFYINRLTDAPQKANSTLPLLTLHRAWILLLRKTDHFLRIFEVESFPSTPTITVLTEVYREQGYFKDLLLIIKNTNLISTTRYFVFSCLSFPNIPLHKKKQEKATQWEAGRQGRKVDIC